MRAIPGKVARRLRSSVQVPDEIAICTPDPSKKTRLGSCRISTDAFVDDGFGVWKGDRKACLANKRFRMRAHLLFGVSLHRRYPVGFSQAGSYQNVVAGHYPWARRIIDEPVDVDR